MKKTLIALALTALPVAAMADVVLYGQIKGGVGSTFSDGNNDGSITQMEDYGSRIGFKGEEDLGNGLKAIWQVEQRVSLAGEQGSEGFNTRDTFIGLEGGFGKVRAGYVSDQFNENMETMDIWEYRSGAGAEARGLGYMTRFDGRSQGVRYDSPDFGGFNFNVTHQLADDAGETAYQNGAEAEGQSTIVGLNYENSGFFGKVGYGFYKDSAVELDGTTGKKVGDTDGHVARVEAGYDANNLFVGLAYQYAKDMGAFGRIGGDGVPLYDVNGARAQALDINGQPVFDKDGNAVMANVGGLVSEKSHEAAISLAYTFGAVTPKITYAHGWDQKFGGVKADNSGYDQVIIGADYALSKRTTALVSAGWINTATAAQYDKEGNIQLLDDDIYSVGVGLRHKF